MERTILYTLGFRLGSPCPLTFLRRISKAEQYDIPSRTVAKYLIEVTILDEKFLAYHPSLLAAASTWLARKMLKKGDWVKKILSSFPLVFFFLRVAEPFFFFFFPF